MLEQEFRDKLKANTNPVVVDFWAPWCGPCKAIEPMLKRLDQEYKGAVDVWRVNADEEQQLLRSLKIYGIPTLIAFNQGEEVARQTGVGSLPSMMSLFEAAQSGQKPAKKGISGLDRILRIGIAIALFFLAYSGGFKSFYLWMAILAGVALFSAVYDRCPIWKVISSKLGDWIKRENSA